MRLREYFYSLFEETGTLTVQQIITYIVVSVGIGLVIYLAYYLTHEGTLYSRKFNVSLLMMTVLTTAVMTVIGNNIVLSLGMVGALSIVRFRTAIKDSRDTAFIYWTIIVGICCGVGDFLAAGIASAAVFLLLLVMGRTRNDERILLIIKADRNNESKIEGLVFEYFSQKASLRVKNTSRETIEFIYELTKRMMNKSMTKNNSITSAIYNLEGIHYVNMVTQNDEITG